MVSINPGVKLSQMLRGGRGSGDMRFKGGTGNAECISGFFMGALGDVEEKMRGLPAQRCRWATARLYALMNLPLKNQDIPDRIVLRLEDTSLLLACWKT